MTLNLNRKKMHCIVALLFICGFIVYVVASNHYYEEKGRKFIGVIDRFENNQAVILIEELGEEIIVNRKLLPSEIEANMWLRFEIYSDIKK
ncbi:DUF3006 domain-containing protein [Oceanobacillus sp. FSL K6-2867]|uniref:DUF3006 domain-containing protein n=1 Tax=Oceanobacillus sp. FSL K6-2867 TaxID=2954748 RepID=UPI0030DA2A07